MKKTIIAFTFSLVISTFSFAQNKQTENIEATYITEIKMDYEKIIQQIPQEYRAQAGPAIKEEIKSGIFLNYNYKNNGKYSVYKLEQKVENAQSGGGTIAQQIATFDNKPTYKDFTVTPTMVYKEMDLAGKSFLIKDKALDYKWKISSEKTEIAGYQATKAEGLMFDSIPVTVWYAPSISIKDGPASLGGLPGLIVKAEFENNGSNIIITLKELKTTDKTLNVTLPTKGQVVTNEEFMKIVNDIQKKYSEMLNNNGVDKK